MSHTYSRISGPDVRDLASDALNTHLIQKSYGKKVTALSLIRALLLVAVWRTSLSAVITRYDFGFSHETARKALYANLEPLEHVTEGLVAALHSFVPRNLRRQRRRRRGWVIAMDTHFCPYYGDRANRDVVGGQKKQGTNYFYCYATAVIVHKGVRYTVGIIPIVNSQASCEIVTALLAQVERLGVKIRGVVLDCGFDSGDTLLLLQERKLSYTIPLRRCGGKKNRRNRYWENPVGTILTMSWTTEKSRRKVSTRAVVMQRPKETRKRVYAFGGWAWSEAGREVDRMRTARRWYRRRFGIETSYRQMNQGKGRTTAKDARYRLLLIGIALLLRQIWIWLLAHAKIPFAAQTVKTFPLAIMLDWLAQALRYRLKEVVELWIEIPETG